MFFYSWVLALVFLATVPLYAWLLRFSSRRLRPMYESLEEAYGEYASYQIDAIRGIETVKAMSAEQPLRASMLAQFRTLATASSRRSSSSSPTRAACSCSGSSRSRCSSSSARRRSSTER